MLAEELHGSGVLAVLTTALFLAEYAADADDVLGRLAGHTFWEIVDTLVTGRRLRADRAGTAQRFGTAAGRWGEMLGLGGGRSSAVVVGRTAAVAAARDLAGQAAAPPAGLRRGHPDVSWRETVVMWWAGMRGVASVALALAIPLKTDDGAPFPDRDEIVFIAFAVIMATLVLQGLTLPWLVRRLGVRADTDAEKDAGDGSSRSGPRRRRSSGCGRSRTAEDLPEDVVERLLRRAYDIGARISPDMVDEERREAYAQRARAAEDGAADPAGDAVARPATRCWRRAASRARTRRSWTGCCGTWTCAACADRTRPDGCQRRGPSSAQVPRVPSAFRSVRRLVRRGAGCDAAGRAAAGAARRQGASAC